MIIFGDQFFHFGMNLCRKSSSTAFETGIFQNISSRISGGRFDGAVFGRMLSFSLMISGGGAHGGSG